MRIAYVLRIFPKLSETFILSELAALRRRGVELTILSLLPPREDLQHELVDAAGLRPLVVYGEDRFRAALAAFAPDVVHAHFATEATDAARTIAAELDVPFTFSAHGYDIYRKPPPDWRERAEAAAAVVTVSNANARFIEQTFGVDPERIRVVPPGVDVDLFRPPATKADDIPLIVCVARLVEVKNVQLLVRACALLHARGVRFRCILVGDGPLRHELHDLCRELGLDETVRFVGAARQGEVARWWQRATIGALPSTNEGFPVSLLEAAACAVPVVATAVGGVPELVIDGCTGLLVGSDDVEGFASALARLLEDPLARGRLGEAARRRVEERFSLERSIDALTALWDEVTVTARVPA